MNYATDPALRDRGAPPHAPPSPPQGPAARWVVRHEEVTIDGGSGERTRRLVEPPGDGPQPAPGRAQPVRSRPGGDRIVVREETWSVVLAATNAGFAADSVGFASHADAAAHLARLIRDDPALAGTVQVVPDAERAG